MFSISSAIAGLAGAVYGHYIVTPDAADARFQRDGQDRGHGRDRRLRHLRRPRGRRGAGEHRADLSRLLTANGTSPSSPLIVIVLMRFSMEGIAGLLAPLWRRLWSIACLITISTCRRRLGCGGACRGARGVRRWREGAGAREVAGAGRHDGHVVGRHLGARATITCRPPAFDDSPEETLAYLRATAPPGWARRPRTSCGRRWPRIRAPMLRFLEDQTPLVFELVNHPDFYVEAPGGKLFGRMVSPTLISRYKLGRWWNKVRPSVKPQYFTYKEMIGGILKDPWRSRVPHGAGACLALPHGQGRAGQRADRRPAARLPRPWLRDPGQRRREASHCWRAAPSPASRP